MRGGRIKRKKKLGYSREGISTQGKEEFSIKKFYSRRHMEGKKGKQGTIVSDGDEKMPGEEENSAKERMPLSNLLVNQNLRGMPTKERGLLN